MKKLFVLLTALSFAAGCATVYDPVARREVRTLFSEQQEIRLGAQVAAHIEDEYEICEDSSKYLQKIGGRVVESSDRSHIEYSFKVLKFDDINAFALPGGFIYMYSGLLEELNEDEVAAVLGHEIGHVVARHGIKRLQAAYGYQMLSLAGLIAWGDRVDPAAALELSNTIFSLIMLGYSRRDELEADRLGTRYAIKAGFAPDGMLGVLEKLDELQRGVPELSFFSTHPPIRERRREVKIVMSALESSEPVE